MYGKLNTLAMVGCACALAVTLACNSAPENPAAPTPSGATGDAGAAPDGSTLKAHPPVPISPTGDVRLTTRSPTMVTNNTQGKYANRTYSYEFQLQDDSGNVIRSATLSAGEGTTTWALGEDLARDTPYRWRVRATLDGAVSSWSSQSRFFTVRENRTPNPGAGRLPIPGYAAGVIAQVAASRRDLLQRSCQDGGGTWEFMDLVVDTLRLQDTRWGYNGKRGNPGDPSHDVVSYNWGNEPDEGTTQVYIFDILIGHCGPSPGPTFADITGVGGALGRWISRGRFAGSQG